MARVPQATDQQGLLRYSNAAVTLHWLTAVLIVVQIWLGFTFADMPKGPARMEVFTWHKTVGVTILLLALIRLAVRLKNPPPPFPQELPRWERLAAVWNHRIFYALLIIIPLAGVVTLIAADLMLAFSSGIAMSFAGIVLWGLHMALTQGLLLRLVAARAPAELRATAFGIFHFASGVALLLSSLAAGLIWDRFGPAATFFTGAGFAGLTALILIAAPRRFNLSQPDPRR